MIKVFKTVNKNLEEIEVADLNEQDIWIYLVSPSPEEIEQITSTFDIPKDFIEDPLDENEGPRMELEDGKRLIITQTPYFEDDEEAVIQFITLPLGIILTEKCIITVSSKDDDVLQNFVKGRVKNFSTAKRNRLILQILSRTATVYLNYLKRINRISNNIEDQLEESMNNELLMDLLDLQKSLVYFATSLRSNSSVLEKLTRIGIFTKYEEDEDLLEDMIIDNKQAIEMTSIHANILKSTMDAFASMISNNLNKVMKFLTSVTIILM
ncbi:MAG TPA: magnesium transporter CorA family protein, partial [Candidatus Cloacimonetes bacterium]|nr:magnesium transporter CorA family protein [Candidatus Cloacimonadota bacterium]HEX37670.1 magnesium transporter CorA family protein [Candidatus Cloacimonadota bacterium]